MSKGIFITFEGNDGCGKTTVSNMIYDYLKDNNYKVIMTREPGGIDIAEQIRGIILNPNNTKMEARTEALLYAAARRQHLCEKVIPALEEGYIVICDRFIDSSLAYQGVGRGLGIEEIYNMNLFAIDKYMPNKTLYLKLDPEIGLERISNRENKDRMDQESIDFHYKVANGYNELEILYSDRIITIDANQELNKVYEDTLKEVLEII